MTEQLDDQDDLPVPAARHALWSDLGFGPALGGLLIAFLAVQPLVATQLGGIIGQDTPYRFLANAFPLAAGLVAIGLGIWTLRTSGEQLARAFAVAAVFVGLLAVANGAIGWYGSELVHDATCRSTTYAPDATDPTDASITSTLSTC